MVWTPVQNARVAGGSPGRRAILPSGLGVQQEAPIDLSGFCDLTGETASDDGLAAAIARAITAGRSGAAAELFLPSGKLVLAKARAALSSINRLHFYGEGTTSFIQQQVDGEPALEWNAGASSVQECIVEGLRIEHVRQQATAPAISLLSTNTNGFFKNRYDISVNQFGAGVQWGDGSGTIPFWDNDLDLHTSNIGASILNNRSSAAVGSPTNRVKLKHSGQATVPTGPALNLGGATQWEFLSLNIEDWTDVLCAFSGAGVVVVRGMHLERHHLVTASVQLFQVGGTNCILVIEGGSNTFRMDGAGPYYFAFFTNSFGKIGGLISNKDVAGSIGAGELRLVNGNAGSIVELESRINTDANIVDYQTTANPGPWLKSDCGQPPTVLSSVAQPVASATYRGWSYWSKGANATTADVLYICLQSATGAYSWKAIATG